MENDWEVYFGYQTISGGNDSWNAHAAEIGVTPWDLAVFDSIWHGHGQVPSTELLVDRAFGNRAIRCPDKAAESVQKCFREGWIQFLTSGFLEKMKADLDAEGYLTPTGIVDAYNEEMGISNVGLISFTKDGADRYLSWLNGGSSIQLREHWALGVDVDGSAAVFGTSIDECEGAIAPSYGDPEICVALEPASKIGRWCDHWWNRFEQGYKIRYTREADAC